MKRVTTGLFAILILCSSFTTQHERFPEQLRWHTHFLADPDPHSPYFALTATRWHYSYNAKITGNNLHIDFKFSAGVDPNESWVKLGQLKNAESRRKLLNHEQGHANINFLLLKDGEQKIRFQKYTVRNYKKAILENARKVSDYYSDMQKRYDAETKHGSDDAQQAKWDAIIERALKEFSN